MAPNASSSPDLRPRSLVLCATAGMLGLLAWLGWFSWDTQYEVDEFGGQSGPYDTWQVVGCGLTLIVALTVAQLQGADRLISSLAVATTFTAGFCISAIQLSTSDDANLFVVGAFLIFVGISVLNSLISVMTRALSRRAPSRP